MRKLGIPDYSRISAVGNLVTVEMEWRKFSAATVRDLRSQVTIGFLRFLPEITSRASHPHICSAILHADGPWCFHAIVPVRPQVIPCDTPAS
jgi:hypothetical protein